MPVLSVLLPVRDALPYLGPSLGSLWRQSLSDFEVIAVDDGSTDGSGEALERAAARERRLRVIHTPPRGLPAALNTALSLARAPIVARHDADDLSHRRRFELQFRLLGERPRVAVVGSRLGLFPVAAAGLGMRRWAAWHNALLAHHDMAAEMLIDSPLAHGTAMIRAAWIERVGGWAERDWPEDLDLWVRLLEAGACFDKRPEVLYAWRQHPRSATRRDPRYRRERFVALKLDALERGVLRAAGEPTLVGVGASLRRWHAALSASRRVRIVEARRPEARALDRLGAPVVLVFTAAPARQRWRNALRGRSMIEGKSFIFVA